MAGSAAFCIARWCSCQYDASTASPAAPRRIGLMTANMTRTEPRSSAKSARRREWSFTSTTQSVLCIS